MGGKRFLVSRAYLESESKSPSRKLSSHPRQEHCLHLWTANRACWDNTTTSGVSCNADRREKVDLNQRKEVDPDRRKRIDPGRRRRVDLDQTKRKERRRKVAPQAPSPLRSHSERRSWHAAA